MKIYGMWRGGERKADVIELTSGKCIVAWPTSVIVYDSIEAARAVHITHMGGRGEPTEFIPEMDECRDRNHVGLERVIHGQRLPCAELGQDAALVAHILGDVEGKLKSFIDAATVLKEQVDAQTEYTRKLQQLAAEARRTGESLTHKIPQPVVHDMSKGVYAVLQVLEKTRKRKRTKRK